MRVVIQRSLAASVSIAGETMAEIPCGLVILLGIEARDGPEDIDWLVGKICRMRIFPDDDGKMNRSLLETGGGALIVSQFTLHASVKKGNRPSFLNAASPEVSEPLYRRFCAEFSHAIGKPVGTGKFGADMQVSLMNDGPVTIVIDSKNRE